MKRLPRKPSRLIRLALSDLRERAADPRYVIDMRYWHNPFRTDGKCSVCFAGSVMARLGLTPDSYSSPGYFPFENNRNKLMALNYFRIGSVRSALTTLSIKSPARLGDRKIPAYDTADPKPFYTAMDRLVKKLESVGL